MRPHLEEPIPANAIDVTPSDSEELPHATRALYVGTGGAVKVTMATNRETVTYKNVGNGTYLPIAAIQVHATDTTAADIVAEW